MADIVELISADHTQIRRLFAELDEAGRRDGQPDGGPGLRRVWETLAGLLELHADAVEEICYQALFGGRASAAGDMAEATADHDDIREAVREARLQAVGCAAWWRAVHAARAATIGHINDTEACAVAHFARQAPLPARHGLGGQWTAFVTARIRDGAPPATGAARPGSDPGISG